MLPLLLGSVVAHAFTVLIMKRSILTEKVARRGYHISREYAVDALERMTIGETMSAPVVTVPASLPVSRLAREYFLGHRRHQGYAVVGESGELLGIVTKSDLLEEWMTAFVRGGSEPDFSAIITYDLLRREPITAFPSESCRTAAERMAQHRVGRLAVVSPEDPRKPIGMVTRSDLLKARSRQLQEEHEREQFLAVSSRRIGRLPVI
jgi:CBS domain-containing protein